MASGRTLARAKCNGWFLGCLLVVLCFACAYAASGGSIVVNPHDQLDGEVLTYILHAKHLGAESYAELMNGIPAEGMQMAAPGMLVLYLLLPSATAFAVAYACIMIVAYVGMYFLSRAFSVRAWVASVVALVFAFLPFYSVYGLSVMGLPLFFYFVKRLWDGQTRGNVISAVTAAVVLALFSSLVLSGFAVALVLVALAAVSCVADNRRRALLLLLVCSALCFAYLAENWSLVLQVLGGSGYESHKSEYALTAASATLLDVVEFFAQGQYHAASNHLGILCFSAASLGVCIVVMFRVRHANHDKGAYANRFRLVKALVTLLLAALFIAAFYVAFHSEVGVGLRSCLPGLLRAFQLDRVYWLYPTIWYLAFGISAELLLSLFAGKVLRFCACSAFTFVAVATLVWSGMSCAPAQTVKASLTGDAGSNVTWSGFFGEELFDQIEEKLNVDKSSTRVISIGLYPSIAAYNGWYCLDAYSNNYPLEYKHEFREIAAGELALDANLESYYDGWGNRCYAFSHELGKNYLISKNAGIVLSDLRIDTDAAKSMGCDYVFSSVEIGNAQSLNMSLIGCFDNDENPYEVWVYALE